MSVITFPSTLKVDRCSPSQRRNDIAFVSGFGSQGLELSAPVWEVVIEASAVQYESDAGAWKSLGLMLRGQTNQLAIWDMARPVPLGTMRGTLLFSANAAQGATTIVLVDATQANKTLLQGDLIGFGTGTTQQVVMVVADAAATAGGVITLTVEAALRNAFTAGDAATWDKPKALYRRTSSKFGWANQENNASGFMLDLVEDWRT